jgi:hypothetical protein
VIVCNIYHKGRWEIYHIAIKDYMPEIVLPPRSGASQREKHLFNPFRQEPPPIPLKVEGALYLAGGFRGFSLLCFAMPSWATQPPAGFLLILMYDGEMVLFLKSPLSPCKVFQGSGSILSGSCSLLYHFTTLSFSKSTYENP